MRRIFKVFENKQTRYLAVGAVNTGWGIVSYPLFYGVLTPFGVTYIWALVVNYVFNSTAAYLLQKHLVFKTKGSYASEYFKFLVVQVGFFAVNIAVLPAAVEVLDINPVLAQTILVLLVAVGSYFWHDKITFKDQGLPEGSGPIV